MSISGIASKMAPRRFLEAHFEHFLGLVPKWLPGGLWRLILNISGPCSQNGSHGAYGGSFSAFLGPAFKVVLRTLLDAFFEHFHALLQNSFQEALKYAVLRGVLRLST